MSGGAENSTERNNATNLLNEVAIIANGNHIFIN